MFLLICHSVTEACTGVYRSSITLVYGIWRASENFVLLARRHTGEILERHLSSQRDSKSWPGFHLAYNARNFNSNASATTVLCYYKPVNWFKPSEFWKIVSLVFISIAMIYGMINDVRFVRFRIVFCVECCIEPLLMKSHRAMSSEVNCQIVIDII